MKKIEDLELGVFTKHIRDRGLKESTVQIYTAIIKRFLATEPNVENLEDYNNFLIKHAIKKTQYNYPYALIKFIDFIVEDTKLKNEMTKGILLRPLKDKQTDSARLTPKQIEDVIHHLTLDKYKLIAKIQHATGARANDIISGLTTKNIHEEDKNGKRILRLMLQTKGGKILTTTLSEEDLIDKLLDYAKKHSNRIIIPEENIDDEFVFLLPPKSFSKIERINSFDLSSNVYRAYWINLKNALTACNIPHKDWATHDFRRNFARTLYKASGFDFELLKQSLNHVRYDTTMKYIKSDPKEVRAIVMKVQEQMQKEAAQYKKKLIVIRDGFIEGMKIGDKLPEPKGLEKDDIADLIILGLENGSLKYM